MYHCRADGRPQRTFPDLTQKTVHFFTFLVGRSRAAAHTHRGVLEQYTPSFLLTAACVAAAAFVPDVVARAAVRTAVLAAAALAAVPAAQPTARVDARASASVAVPAASQLKTSYSYFDIATSLQGCSDEIALTFMGSVTLHSFVISTFQGTL